MSKNLISDIARVCTRALAYLDIAFVMSLRFFGKKLMSKRPFAFAPFYTNGGFGL